ncbi:MAG: membrane protein insertase YidC [Bdellovibrionales bacterium]|nr:membrane protein insertase YidC [Bdellovibrionales bacterium]
MRQPDSPSFFDIRTILTIVVMGVTFIGWQAYMQKKYPDYGKKTESQQVAAPATPAPGETTTPAGGATGGKAPATGSAIAANKESLQPEKLIPYATETLKFQISSYGMGLKNVEIPRYKNRNGDVVSLGHPAITILPLETRLLGRPEPVEFAVEKVNDNLFVGRAKVGGLQITKTMEIDPAKYLFKFKVQTSGADPRFVGLTTALTEEITNVGGGSFFMPQVEFQEFYLETADNNHERLHFTKEDEHKTWNKVRVASIGSQYFTNALLDKSPIMPEAKSSLNHKEKAAELILQYPVLNPGHDFQLEYDAFIGPKSYTLLSSIDPLLAKVVDFGWFNWIARQIFMMLNWFHALVGNWGVAIILLTVVVRILVLPFNVYSYKSMQAMQKIQPLIQGLKEKYKDDQQKQQAEMMKLMRENKVNPVGGCLPIFLQFPIFIALYQVLGHSIELYQAPFGLWIHDLSLKDPYYILPVLMGITMFIQQKTTPNATMDPAQAKILLMMPLVFTFFMLSLPSGLTLYMLVGAVFSVAQQTYFMRTHQTPSVVAHREVRT